MSDRIDWIPLSNVSGELVPSGALARVTGVANRLFVIDKPDADSDPDLVAVGLTLIPREGRGQGTFDPRAVLAYEAADGVPQPGEEWGAGAGTWKLRKGKKGWRILGGAGGGLVNALRVGGGTGLTERCGSGSGAGSGSGSDEGEEKVSLQDELCLEGVRYVTRGRLRAVVCGGAIRMKWSDLVTTEEGCCGCDDGGSGGSGGGSGSGACPEPGTACCEGADPATAPVGVITSPEGWVFTADFDRGSAGSYSATATDGCAEMKGELKCVDGVWQFSGVVKGEGGKLTAVTGALAVAEGGATLEAVLSGYEVSIDHPCPPVTMVPSECCPTTGIPSRLRATFSARTGIAAALPDSLVLSYDGTSRWATPYMPIAAGCGVAEELFLFSSYCTSYAGGLGWGWHVESDKNSDPNHINWGATAIPDFTCEPFAAVFHISVTDHPTCGPFSYTVTLSPA